MRVTYRALAFRNTEGIVFLSSSAFTRGHTFTSIFARQPKKLSPPPVPISSRFHNSIVHHSRSRLLADPVSSIAVWPVLSVFSRSVSNFRPTKWRSVQFSTPRAVLPLLPRTTFFQLRIFSPHGVLLFLGLFLIRNILERFRLEQTDLSRVYFHLSCYTGLTITLYNVIFVYPRDNSIFWLENTDWKKTTTRTYTIRINKI